MPAELAGRSCDTALHRKRQPLPPRRLGRGWRPTCGSIAGTLGAGHGHSDQLHVDLYARGEDILTDAGRYTYVNKPERFEFKNSSAHNTVTVDDEEVYTPVDSWELFAPVAGGQPPFRRR